MNSKKNHRTYKKIFEEWDSNRTQLIFRDKIHYNPQPDEVFRQAYLPTTANKEPFYKARHQLPKYWFVSNLGTVITVKNNKIELLIGQFCQNDRLQIVINHNDNRIAMARESLVALVFNDNVPCTDEARELINKKGLDAFKRRLDCKCIELHHTNGYIHPQEPLNVLQIMQNLPSNCKPNAIQLVTRYEHFYIHNKVA